MTASTEVQKARYLSNPRKCIDCGGDPSAGRPRCTSCHNAWTRGEKPTGSGDADS